MLPTYVLDDGPAAHGVDDLQAAAHRQQRDAGVEADLEAARAEALVETRAEIAMRGRPATAEAPAHRRDWTPASSWRAITIRWTWLVPS